MATVDLDPSTILYGDTDHEHQRLDVSRPGSMARSRYQELCRQIQTGDLFTAIDTLEAGHENFSRAPLLQQLSEKLLDKIFADVHAAALKENPPDIGQALTDPLSISLRRQVGIAYADQIAQGAGVEEQLSHLRTGGILDLAYLQERPGPLLKERSRLLQGQDLLSLDVFTSSERKALSRLTATDHEAWLYLEFRRRVAHALQSPLRGIYADLLIERRYQNQVLIRRRNPRGQTLLHLHHDLEGQTGGETYCGQTLPRTLRIAPRGAWTSAADGGSTQFRRCPKCEAAGEGPSGPADDPVEYPVFKTDGQLDTMVTTTIHRLTENNRLHETDLSSIAYASARAELIQAVADDLSARGYYSAFWRVSPSMRWWRQKQGLTLAEADAMALNAAQLQKIAVSLVDERSPERLKALLRAGLRS